VSHAELVLVHSSNVDVSATEVFGSPIAADTSPQRRMVILGARQRSMSGSLRAPRPLRKQPSTSCQLVERMQGAIGQIIGWLLMD